MKNYVLIDFTEESIDALRYATEFTKETKGTLEIVNVADATKRSEDTQDLEVLASKFSSDDFEIKINELVGEMEDELPAFLNREKAGFVFCGPHALKSMEPFFSSRALNLLNNVTSNFIFIPKELKKFSPIEEILIPIFNDHDSIQNIEALIYLHQFMPFTTRLITANNKDAEMTANAIVASKLLSKAGMPFKTEFSGKDEDEMRDGLVESAKLLNSDMISIVNLTEVNLFNFGAKGFVENLIRNDYGFPVLVIQHQQNKYYSGFHTTGGH